MGGRATHYPPWGSGTEAVSLLDTGVDVSLPPMGIRNWAPASPWPRAGTAHYPPWGSGTATGESDMRNYVISLPPMGIRNVAERLGHVERVHLITPHGDQEPGIPLIDYSATYDSLPPMGIRNQVVPVEHALHRLKLSLPPMGIRNPLGLELPLDGLELITPHGDQEPERHTHARAGPRPHYPPWGSGTMRSALMRRSSSSSLPPMGIRNVTLGGHRTPHP